MAGMLTVYGVYLTPYFAGHLGVALTAIAGSALIVRMIDLFIDPLLGWAMDRTRTPIGRFRPWMLAGVPLYLTSVYMLFFAAKGIGVMYLIVWGLALGVGTSLLTLSSAAWAANLATNYNERSTIYGIMGGVGAVGALLFLMLQITFAKAHPGGFNAIQLSGWAILIGVPLTVILMTAAVPEPIAPSLRTPFALRDFKEMIARPEMLRLVAADFALALGPGTTAPLYLFFFRDSLGFTTIESTELLMLYTVASLFGGPLLGLVATKINKHRTLIWATVGYAVCQVSLFVIPKGMFIAAVPGMVGCGFIASGFLLLIRAMIADVGDEVRLEQGKERMSLLYSMVTTTTKVGTAITTPITYTVLAYVGYTAVEGAKNTPAAIHGLEMCYVFAPVVFVLVGGACLIGYKLDAKRHAEIRAQLDLRDAGAGTQAVIDVMSGAPIAPPSSST